MRSGPFAFSRGISFFRRELLEILLLDLELSWSRQKWREEAWATHESLTQILYH